MAKKRKKRLEEGDGWIVTAMCLMAVGAIGFVYGVIQIIAQGG